ncbi:hypothetical protein OWM07_10590 [Deferribacter thermophilus]|uniref:CARDB domain-containing protein n=1 Tax=Deferribacter thermophilus TaxID=53573 RepID=UPI003C132D66
MKRFLFFLIIFININFLVFAEEVRFSLKVLPVPPLLSVSIDFQEPSGNKILDAEETGKLILKIKNKGNGDTFDVKAKIFTKNLVRGLSFDDEIYIGTIPSGSTVVKEVDIKSDESLPTSKVTFIVKINELNGFNPKPVGIAFKTHKFEEPVLKIVDYKITDSNRNGKIEPIEQVEIKARIQNIGKGPAENVKAVLELGDNVFVGGDLRTEYDLGNLKPGAYKDISFVIYANSLIENNQRIP